MFEKHEIPRQRSRCPLLIASLLGHAAVLLIVGVLHPFDPPSLKMHFVGVVYAGGETPAAELTDKPSEKLYHRVNQNSIPAATAPPPVPATPAVNQLDVEPNSFEWERLPAGGRDILGASFPSDGIVDG